MRLPKRSQIAFTVAGSLALLAVPAAAASTPPPSSPPPRGHEIRDIPPTRAAGPPRHVLRRAQRELRRSARRSPVARAALTESNVRFDCSSAYENASVVVARRAMFGARVGEPVWVRQWIRVAGPTRDKWFHYGDAWLPGNPYAPGELNASRIDVGRGEWVSAALQTWSASTGPDLLTWYLTPRRYEPMNFLSTVQLSGLWCMPWP